MLTNGLSLMVNDGYSWVYNVDIVSIMCSKGFLMASNDRVVNNFCATITSFSWFRMSTD